MTVNKREETMSTGDARLYGKLFASLYQGSLRGQAHEILVFTCLIAHQDREGFVDIHPRAIAEAVGLTTSEVRSALDNLEAPDPESRTPDEEGRRLIRIDEHRQWGWRIVNSEKYRALRDAEDRRTQFRESQRKTRAKKKALSQTTEPTDVDPSGQSYYVNGHPPPSTDVNIGQPPSTLSAQVEEEVDADAEAEPSASETSSPPQRRRERRGRLPKEKPPKGVYSEAFLKFWARWPSQVKVGKAAAFTAWCDLSASDQELAFVALGKQTAPGAQLDPAKPLRPDGSSRLPYPGTWLNGRRFEDEPIGSTSEDSPPPSPPQTSEPCTDPACPHDANVCHDEVGYCIVRDCPCVGMAIAVARNVGAAP